MDNYQGFQNEQQRNASSSAVFTDEEYYAFYDEGLEKDKKAVADIVASIVNKDKGEQGESGDDEDSSSERDAGGGLIETIRSWFNKYGSSVFGNGGVLITLLVMVVAIIASIVNIFSAFVEVNVELVQPSAAVSVLLAVGLFMFFVSTAYNQWNYDISKKAYLLILVSLFSVLCIRFYYSLINMVIVPLLLLPKPNEWVTPTKWMFLIRALTIMPTIFFSVMTIKTIAVTVFDPLSYNDISRFRILDHVDLRKNKKYLYDATVVRRLSNGRAFTIREHSRFEHMLINGPSGTAKTTCVITPMVNNDLNKKCINEDYVKNVVVKMLEKGELFMNAPTSDESFSIDAFSVTDKKFEKVLDELKRDHRQMGITVMAPDDSLTDSIYDLCKAKGVPCNRIDPIPAPDTNGKRKEGFVSFNPLYISPKTPSWRRSIEIIKAASLFADVLQAIQEMKGKTDPYFSSLNRSATVCFSICLCVTFEKIHHRQPTPADVQFVVNDFSRIRPYYDELVLVNQQNDNIYGFVCDFISYDCLGPGKDKMSDQSRGLRIIMNEFLSQPLLRRVLCPKEGEPILDMDKMLAEGQVTVVNFGKSIGGPESRGFGVFILLSFLDAVYRRPGTEHTRLPHMLCIDELPDIIHPDLEAALAQFRKFRCGVVMALQSLEQMKKNDTTKYLKGTLMEGCAHHFLFGRCSTTEMREYSELAGKQWISTESTRISETALTLDEPSLSTSVTETLEERDVVSATQIRGRLFQQITMFSVVNGNIISPFAGKVDFLKDSEKKPRKRVHYDWDALYSKYGTAYSIPDQKTEEEIAKHIPANDSHGRIFEHAAVATDTGFDGTEAAPTDADAIDLDSEDIVDEATSSATESTFAAADEDTGFCDL